MAKKANRYKTIDGFVIGSHDGMAAIYRPKVIIARQILALSAATIAEAFGVIGRQYIDGVREAMLDELDGCQTPLCSWREVAARLNGRADQEDTA